MGKSRVVAQFQRERSRMRARLRDGVARRLRRDLMVRVSRAVETGEPLRFAIGTFVTDGRLIWEDRSEGGQSQQPKAQRTIRMVVIPKPEAGCCRRRSSRRRLRLPTIQ